MKCLKLLKQQKHFNLGDIIRTTDQDAADKVRGGYWSYASKEEWKSSNHRPTKKVDEDVENQPKVKKGKSKKELKLERKRNS